MNYLLNRLLSKFMKTSLPGIVGSGFSPCSFPVCRVAVVLATVVVTARIPHDVAVISTKFDHSQILMYCKSINYGNNLKFSSLARFFE